MKPIYDSVENKVLELLNFAKSHNLSEMAWAENGLRISFRRNTVTKNVSPSPVSSNGQNGKTKEVEIAVIEEVVRSPMVGTFRRTIAKDRPSLILAGNQIKVGERLGVVECMKIPTDVVSSYEGIIFKILVEEGQVVEYGQPLFVVKPFNG